MGETVEQTSLLLLGDWGPVAISVFALVAVLALLITWLDVADLPPARRFALLGLRAFALGAGIVLLLEPALERKQVSRIRNHVAVVVDTSQSAELPAGSGDTRWEHTLAAVRELQQLSEERAESHVFDVYTVGGALAPSGFDALLSDGFAPREQATDLSAALTALDERYAPGELGGVVLISDGTDLAELGRRVVDGEPLDTTVAASVTALAAPLHTLATAPADSIRDIAVERVRHDDFAFVRNAVTVHAELGVLGYSSGELNVVLRREGAVLQTRTVALEADRSRYDVSFEFVPELLGKEIYSVEVSQRDGEALASNNVQFFVLKVVRDRIRVLQVVGAPSWDVRFLRQLLKGDPNIDLISFFILRGNEDVNRAPNSQMALIPFPVDELFDEELPSFDLVILQNFDYEPYWMAQYLPNIRDYVMGGGGLAMIGGERSFAAAGYGTTAVAEVLPVSLPPSRDRASTVDGTSFRPVLTDAGQRHPITRILFDRAENAALWESMPTMRGTNVVLGAVPGATTLLEHPTRRGNGGAMPVLAVADRGEGRSMALTIDDAWRWSFESVRDGGTSRAYTAFWNSAIRWLIRDPELNLVQVAIPREMVQPGEVIEATVRVFNVDYSPAVGAAGRWQMVRRDLEALRRGEQVDEEVVASEEFVTDASGRVVVRYEVPSEGAYRLVATASVESAADLEDDEVFLSVATSRELRTLEPRPALLAALSAASEGGQAAVLPSRVASLRFHEARIEQVGRREVLDVWSSPWVLLFFAGLLGAEWWLRRRWGRL